MNDAETNRVSISEMGDEGSETKGASAANAPELIGEELTSALAAAQAQAEEYYGRLQRLQAEFDNFRKRTHKEKEELVRYASENLITALLPTLDNFERAFASAGSSRDFDAFLQGVEMIYNQIAKILEEQGLKAIETVGNEFDPNLHEAVLQEASDQEPNLILQELQKGYRIKDKVVRYSKVKVSC